MYYVTRILHHPLDDYCVLERWAVHPPEQANLLVVLCIKGDLYRVGIFILLYKLHTSIPPQSKYPTRPEKVRLYGLSSQCTTQNDSHRKASPSYKLEGELFRACVMRFVSILKNFSSTASIHTCNPRYPSLSWI